MLKKILLDQERILLHDTLSYLIGPVKVPAALVITNHRLLILPNQNWSKSLGYEPRSLTWSDVTEFSLGYLGKNLQISTRSEQFSLWGNAAKRTHALLTHWRDMHISLDSSWALLQQEHVALSTEVQVQAGVGLTITGDLLIQQTGFKLSYKVLDDKDYQVQWSDLTAIEYKSLSQTLSLSWGKNKIKLQGNQAQLMHQIIEVFGQGDIFIDGIWEGKWRHDNNNGSGFIFMGQQALYLVSCGMLSDKEVQIVPCSNIEYLEVTDDGIELHDKDSAQWFLEIDTPNIWVGYHTRLLLMFWKNQNLSFTDRVLQDTCAYVHNDKDALTMGRLVYDTTHVVFFPNGNLEPLRIPIIDIVKLSERSSRLRLHNQAQPTIFEFIDAEAVANVSQLLETQLSPMSVSFSRDNQPISDILGVARKLTVFMDGATLVTLEHSTIVERDGILHFRCKKFQEPIVIPKGVRIEVDIISPQGHYGFFGILIANHLNTSNTEGRYALHIQMLGTIKLINQRAAFRVPTNEDVTFNISTQYKSENELVGQMVDLSSGGCQIVYQEQLNITPQVLCSDETTLTTYIPITLIKENKRRQNRRFGKKEVIKTIIELPGKVRRASISDEDDGTLVLGIEFTGSTPKDEYRLLRKILALERELSKHHQVHKQRKN